MPQHRIQALLDELTATGAETGAQVAAYHHGELVVDVWSGLADVASGRPVDGDTLFPSFSAGKGVAATVLAVLVDREVLDYDALVMSYWPEYGVRGKERTTIGQVLSHSAGVPLAPGPGEVADPFDVEEMTAWLAEQEPLWEPGTASGYHGWTFGFLVAEIVRRATGRELDEVLREEVAEPLGVAGSLLFSVPDETPTATIYDGSWNAALEQLPDDFGLFRIVPKGLVTNFAEASVPGPHRRAAVASTGTMSARAAARMYAAMGAGGELDGVRLLSPATVERATRVRTSGEDRIFGEPVPKSYGFFLGHPGGYEVGSRSTAFGMNGSGGSLAFADPERGLAFAFTHNRLAAGEEDMAGRIVAEVRDALGVPDAA